MAGLRRHNFPRMAPVSLPQQHNGGHGFNAFPKIAEARRAPQPARIGRHVRDGHQLLKLGRQLPLLRLPELAHPLRGWRGRGGGQQREQGEGQEVFQEGR